MLVGCHEIADRIARLISLNMTNKKNGVYTAGEMIRGSEAAIHGVERFDLERAWTDFTVTTTVDMRMLFLSLPFAQNREGAVLPTMPLVVRNEVGY